MGFYVGFVSSYYYKYILLPQSASIRSAPGVNFCPIKRCSAPLHSRVLVKAVDIVMLAMASPYALENLLTLHFCNCAMLQPRLRVLLASRTLPGHAVTPPCCCLNMPASLRLASSVRLGLPASLHA